MFTARSCTPVTLRFHSRLAVETYSRVMMPDDANPAGNVHGGTILKMIELCGFIVATKHANASRIRHAPLSAALLRVEHMDFQKPVFVGDLAILQSRLTFVSPHTMEVEVNMAREDLSVGERIQTNTAKLWYGAISQTASRSLASTRHAWDASLARVDKLDLAPIPPLPAGFLTAEEEEAGKQRYLDSKLKRKLSPDSFEWPMPPRSDSVTLSQLVLPGDCTPCGLVYGGVLMKLMDNAAGILAVRYCRTNAVTACIEAVDFHSPAHLGDVVTVTAIPSFSSSRSLEIEVLVTCEDLLTSRVAVTCHAFYTFVSKASDGTVRPISQLKPATEADVQRFESGRQRYLNRRVNKTNSDPKALGSES